MILYEHIRAYTSPMMTKMVSVLARVVVCSPLLFRQFLGLQLHRRSTQQLHSSRPKVTQDEDRVCSKSGTYVAS